MIGRYADPQDCQEVLMSHIVGLATLALGLALAMACGPSPDASEADIAARIEALGEYPSARLSAAGTIGDSEAFGSIDAIQLISGRLAVLDAMNSRVSLYSADGQLLSRFGRRGEGPGELSLAVDLAWTPAEELLVLDRGNQKVLALKSESDSLVLAREFNIRLSVGADMCLMGDRIFVLGNHEGNLVHEISPDGTLLQSFGARSDGDVFKAAHTVLGRIACSGTAQAIALVPLTLGELRIFSADGTSLVAESIPEYAEQVINTDGISVRLSMPDEGFSHITAAVNWLDANALLVQLNRVPEAPTSALEGRLFRLDGGWSSAEPTLPRVLEQSEDTIYVMEADPYPVVRVYGVR
jgi:hypothetical protein